MKKQFKLLSSILAALSVMSASSITFAAPKINIKVPVYKKVFKYGIISAGVTAAAALTAVGAYKILNEKTIEINSEKDFEQIKKCRNTVTKAIINIEEIPPNAFEYCSNLKEVDLHGVKSIGSEAFISCLKLTTVKNTSDVENIGEFAFCNCVALKKIDFPNVSKIKACTFFRCTSLNKISLPSVESILNNAFAKCLSLKNVILPKNSKNLEKIISSQKAEY